MYKNSLPIVLLTDFGHKDPFVGILKGVIARINPDAAVIDLTHGINPQDILQASFLLFTSFSYFPENSIFCAVVDPGVGSRRKSICIRTQHYYFIGPDNGLLWMSAQKDGIRQIIHLTNTDYFLENVSSTFHGRDIFAPVAAWISRGSLNTALLGATMESCVKYELPAVEIFKDQMTLTVIDIDRFGNIALNITRDDFNTFIQQKTFTISYHDRRIDKQCKTYSEGNPQEPFIVPSSSSYMEIAVKNDSAARLLQARCLDNMLLTRQK